MFRMRSSDLLLACNGIIDKKSTYCGLLLESSEDEMHTSLLRPIILRQRNQIMAASRPQIKSSPSAIRCPKSQS